jgi:hypothetical protein
MTLPTDAETLNQTLTDILTSDLTQTELSKKHGCSRQLIAEIWAGRAHKNKCLHLGRRLERKATCQDCAFWQSKYQNCDLGIPECTEIPGWARSCPSFAKLKSTCGTTA